MSRFELGNSMLRRDVTDCHLRWHRPLQNCAVSCQLMSRHSWPQQWAADSTGVATQQAVCVWLTGPVGSTLFLLKQRTDLCESQHSTFHHVSVVAACLLPKSLKFYCCLKRGSGRRLILEHGNFASRIQRDSKLKTRFKRTEPLIYLYKSVFM